jgi:glycosyltransferase involved in cell wall biosynthesis
MSGTPEVSFIMGVYRCEDPGKLRASVESVVSQTFGDWELIMVDDGSDDGGATYAAMRDAAALDGRITALSYEENHGLAYALDYCLERARGRYIARQDDDDLSEPGRLAEEVAFLDSHPDVSIVGTNATLFDDEGEWGSLTVPERPDARSFLWNSPFIHPSVVMRAEALRSVGGYRIAPETLLLEDYDLFMRMYASGMRGANIQRPLYRYRSDRRTSKPRPMAARMREAKVRARDFRALGLGAGSLPYIAKPILVGLVPKRLYGAIQNGRTSS